MRIALLCHTLENIGHRFMAIGFREILRAAFGKAVSIEGFEQHHPFSVFPHGSPLRLIDRFPHGRISYLRRLLSSRLLRERLLSLTRELKFDLAVAAGGPNIAPGVASGFCVLSEMANVHYKVSREYDPDTGAGVLWRDPDLGIPWPIAEPVMSDRDASYPRLRDIPPERLPAVG